MFHPQGPTFFELARQALSSTQRGYDLLAPKFDYTPFRTGHRVLRAVSQQLAEIGPFNDGVDICCGTGAGMEMLQQHCHNSLSGVDFSPGMLAVARHKLADCPLSIDWIQQDVLTMEFPERQFDVAICFGALGHILPSQQSIFLQRVASCLRPGGKFVFVTSTMPSLFSTTYWFARSFNAAMHVRNWVIRPPFVMFYLTFLWPHVKTDLISAGFDVDCRPTFPDANSRLGPVQTVIATRQ